MNHILILNCGNSRALGGAGVYPNVIASDGFLGYQGQTQPTLSTVSDYYGKPGSPGGQSPFCFIYQQGRSVERCPVKRSFKGLCAFGDKPGKRARQSQQ